MKTYRVRVQDLGAFLDKTVDETRDECLKRSEKATRAAARLLVEEIQEVIGVHARLVPGVLPARAATRATPGAPPRMVTGALRASTGWTRYSERRVTVFNQQYYAPPLEYGNHPFFFKTVLRMQPLIVTTMTLELTA